MSETDSMHPANSASGPDRGRIRLVLLIAVVVALILAVWGILSRIESRSALKDEAAQAAIPTVAVVKPSHSAPTESLTLPGNTQSYIEAPIYARTSGYLKRWLVDIGAPVKAGQLLAEIDTPEVDQQLSQARADLATAVANRSLADTTNERWKGLLATDSVSKQDADQKAGDAAAKRAAEDSARANVRRLDQLQSFKRVVAPFDGVVTARNTDVGALINAGASGPPGGELFRVADTHILRIYVQVPQPYAGFIKPGLAADLKLNDRPGKNYQATVVSTAQALDPTSRTLLTQLQVDNAKGELFPGAYVEVHFKLPTRTDVVRLPANTLLFRSAGLQVGVVGADNHVSLKSINMGRDFGNEVEVLSGITDSDQVVLNPQDSLADGQEVRIAAPPPAHAEATPDSGSKSGGNDDKGKDKAKDSDEAQDKDKKQ